VQVPFVDLWTLPDSRVCICVLRWQGKHGRSTPERPGDAALKSASEE
jgi:hypothetical protein